MDLIINPTFKSLIPQISPEEYQALEQSVVNEGCRDAIVTWQDQILDGHNRYGICQKHNIPFRNLEKDFANELEAKIWIIQNQLGRRNLPPHERARLALALKPYLEEKAKEQQKRKPESVPQKSAEQKIETREELAKLAGVSHDTIHKVEVIQKEAPEEIKEAVRKGEISVNKAYKAVRKSKRPNIKKKNKNRNKATTINREAIINTEFREAFDLMVIAIKNSRALKWRELSKEAIFKHLDILRDITLL